MNHNKYRIFSCLTAVLAVIVILAPSAFSEMATTAESERVCRNWMNQLVMKNGGWGGVDTPEIMAVREISADGVVLARCYDIEPSGQVVVPVLKNMTPIKLYSEEFRFDPDDADGFPALLREVLGNTMQMFVDTYGSLDAVPADKGPQLLDIKHRQQWDYYLQDESEFKAALAQKDAGEVTSVGPLLASTWHQDSPYNLYCPPGDGGQTIVGCVATAVAQIMNYHQWPPEGTGSRSYYWGGDVSCEGSSPGQTLEAQFDDPYDWDNIINSLTYYSSQAQKQATAELCYEVGVAYLMDYGVCGSGTYTTYTGYVLPNYFRFRNNILEPHRASYNLLAWSDVVRNEVEAGRPILYTISRHAIVADGWRDMSGSLQVHMNYGWGGSYNAWYVFDNLHCNWEGCSSMNEYMHINISPDNGVQFESDLSYGYVPFEVSFTGISPLEVDSWSWDFGDGEYSSEQSPVHVYDDPGRYDVTLQIVCGTETHEYATKNYITALADTIKCDGAMGEPDSDIEIEVHLTNTIPIRDMKIPVEYGGSMNLIYLNYTTEGCRTDYFDQKTMPAIDTYNGRMYFSFYNTEMSTPDLVPGTGPVVKIQFRIPATADPEDIAPIELDGYGSSYLPILKGPVLNFTPVLKPGSVTLPFMCGDTNEDELCNLSDILYLISYVYGNPKGPAPVPSFAGDVNDDGNINLSDILLLIAYVYGDPPGPAPDCP